MQSLTKKDQIFDKMQALNFDPQEIFDLFEHDKCRLSILTLTLKKSL